jgi:hypothetical protein
MEDEMNRLTVLLCCLLSQLADEHSLCAKRDKETILSRCEHEGLSFLTITLPEFGAAIERSIELGMVQKESFPSFGKQRSRCLPKFLSGFTNQMFTVDGMLRPDFNPALIFAIRSVCYLNKKLRMPCSPAREKKAIASYKANEEVLYHAQKDKVFHRGDYFLDATAKILSVVFNDISEDLVVGAHGPGVTADRLLRNARRRLRKWPDRAEPVFSSELHCLPNFGHFEELGGVEYLGVTQEPPVRVVFVPKTLKAPRVIAIEPSHMQFLQQGVLRYMVPRIEEHRLTRRSIRFRDQQPNRDAAMAASVSRDYSTLDMKDASDLVSLALVQRIFRYTPLLDFLEGSRSLHAQLPDGSSVLLQKFASMGSATCFPVEAFVFYCIIQAAIHEHLDLTPSEKSVENISRYLKVYGDDIIVPIAWHEFVVAKLESYCLRVNRHKSFSRSHFRESCGGDYYKGEPVKPVYLKEVIPDGNNHWPPEAVMHVTKVSDEFYRLGYWATAQLLRNWIETAVKCKVPYSSYETDGLTFFSYRYDTYHRYNSNLCRYERRVRRFVPRRCRDDISEDGIASITLALESIRGGSNWNDARAPLDLCSSVKHRSFARKTGWSR